MRIQRIGTHIPFIIADSGGINNRKQVGTTILGIRCEEDD